MIEDLVRQLVGNDAQVSGIMKVGEDPHTYDVRPNDAVTLSRADLVLANGFHLEATLDRVIQQSARGRVVHLAEAADIQPLGSETYAGAADPHCWMDAALFKRYAEAARDALIDADPPRAESYRRRARAYLDQLDDLDNEIRAALASIPQDRRVVVTSHDAFNYYAAAYDLEVHGVIGISTDAQPNAADLEALRQLIRDRKVRALFIETSVAPTLNQIVRNLADDTAVNLGGTLFSDSLGPPDSGGDTYLNMMRHNTRAIVEALR